jgi:hypothetical protein
VILAEEAPAIVPEVAGPAAARPEHLTRAAGLDTDIARPVSRVSRRRRELTRRAPEGRDTHVLDAISRSAAPPAQVRRRDPERSSSVERLQWTRMLRLFGAPHYRQLGYGDLVSARARVGLKPEHDALSAIDRGADQGVGARAIPSSRDSRVLNTI